jgi:superfamily II DNA or RNA helicase
MITKAASRPYFAIIIRKHRFLERIFSAHLIRRVSDTDPDSLISVSRLSPDTFGRFDYSFTAPEIEIIKTIGRYADDRLLILLEKNVKSLPEFFKRMESDPVVREYILNYVERMMLTVFDIAAANNIPVYLKREDYENILAGHCLTPVADPAEVIFNFDLKNDEIRYHISAVCGKEKIILRSPHTELICTNPCILRTEKKLYKFPTVDGKKLSPFFTKPYISIPGATKRKYMETFVLNTLYSCRVTAKGFDIRDIEKNRQTILAIEERLSGGWAFFLRLGYGNKDFLYGSGQKVEVSLEVDHENYCFYRFKRNMEWEDQQAAMLTELGLVNNSGASLSEYVPGTGYEKNSLYGLINWLNDHPDALQKRNIIVRQPDGKTPFYLGNTILDVTGKENRERFDIYGKIKLSGGFEIPFLHIRRYLMNGIREIVLPDHTRFVIPETWFTKYRTLFLFGKESGDKLTLPRKLFNLLIDSGIDAPDAGELRRRFIESKPEEITLPAGLKTSLRNYQKEGVMWLKLLDANHIGGCLADDMGLGKTLQTLTFLQLLKEEKAKKSPLRNQTTLIVVPISLVHNWLNEIHRFTTGFRVHVFTGAQRTKSIDRLTHYDLIITTYGVVRNDVDLLKDILFDYVVLDESQLIKNPASKIYHAVLQLNARGYLTLSGTPIENSLMDLWAQLNFLNRGVFGSRKSFHDEFVIPIEKEGNEAKKSLLKKLIEPFILRRKKEDVAKDLPEITEQIIYCEMTESQAGIYETEKNSIRNTLLQTISEQGFERSAISILRGLTRLRQISNHPAMIYAQDTHLDSGKFEEILRSLENVISEGHKVLVFSSFVKHLNLVAAHLDQSATKYEKLTGSTINRKATIHKFCQEATIPVFLISIKAGGIGLNLTAADYIFILDPWWNPAVENQAVSRAHRIGQEKNLFVYRFISVGTVEEKIIRMQEKKELLAKDFTESANPLRLLGKEKVLEMLN